MPGDETSEREAARTRIFDGARTLASALVRCDSSERWEPLRDLLVAGLQAGGFDDVAESCSAVRTASGELAAAALDARRRLANDHSGPSAGRVDAS